MESKHYFKISILATVLLLGAYLANAQSPRPELPAVYIVPNFHPASCGWLTDWSTERNYCKKLPKTD